MPMIGAMKVQNRTWWYVFGSVLLFLCMIGVLAITVESRLDAFATHPLRVPVWALVVGLTVVLPPAVLWICNRHGGS